MSLIYRGSMKTAPHTRFNSMKTNDPLIKTTYARKIAETTNDPLINKLQLLGVTFGFNLLGVVSRARRDMHN